MINPTSSQSTLLEAKLTILICEEISILDQCTKLLHPLSCFTLVTDTFGLVDEFRC